MKKHFLSIIAMILMTFKLSAAEADKFIFETTSTPTSFFYAGSGYPFTVHWINLDDPSLSGSHLVSTYETRDITLPTTGNYSFSVDPSVDTNFNYYKHYGISIPITIKQWGTTKWVDITEMFAFNNVILDASDIPNMDNVTSLNRMFYYSTVTVIQPINHWNTSSITDMSQMFNKSTFNADILNWDVSNVTNMSLMFSGTTIFDQSLNDWNVSNVANMSYMFYRATSFNQPLDNWDVSNVTNMIYMFSSAGTFNQPLNNWDVSNVTDMSYMFYQSSSFNQPLNDWDVSNVTNLEGMFLAASSFNRSLADWNLYSASYLYYIFDGSGMDCINYSHTLAGWAANENTNSGVLMEEVGLLAYNSDGAIARDILISDLGWSITGDVFDPECPGPLSVNDLNLSADVTQHQVTLDWTMVDDEQVEFYQVQAAEDAHTFHTITTTQDSKFTLFQNTPRQYYRVVARMKDGQSFLSNMLKVELYKEATSISLYPNPVTQGAFNIELPESGILKVYDVLGKEVLTADVTKGNNTISTQGLPSGMYYAQFNGTAIKFIIE